MQCPQWAMHLNHLPGPSHSVSRVCCESAVSGVLCVSYGELISGCLPLADVSHPGSQADMVSNWKSAQFGRGCHLWGQDCPYTSGSGCCLPASLPPVGDGPVHSHLALLWYSLNPLFCEWVRLHLKLELLGGKFYLSLFYIFLFLIQKSTVLISRNLNSLSGYPTVWVAVSH